MSDALDALAAEFDRHADNAYGDEARTTWQLAAQRVRDTAANLEPYLLPQAPIHDDPEGAVAVEAAPESDTAQEAG